MRQLFSIKQHLTSRFFLGLGMIGFVAALAANIGSEGTPDSDVSTPAPTPPSTPVPASAEEGQLGARPETPEPTGAAQPGLHRLGITSGRDGLIYVPTGHRAGRPTALALLLHGAGGNAQHGISLLQPLADANNLLLLAPDSRKGTWDVIVSDYGQDVEYIDRALAQTFSRYDVDPAHVAIGGFSDGASYALSLGITNGDLFTHIIAFSPGFMVPTRQEGQPRIYVSHGTHDQVLSIDACSRRIVPQLRRAHYDITYHEFDGPHTVPPTIALEAVKWFTG